MAGSSQTNTQFSAKTPFQRVRLYSPSLITLLVLLPFFALYFHAMKSAQAYLNDRAFRILDITSRQFGAEITGVSSAMDAANILPEQLCVRQADKVLSPRAAWEAGKHAPAFFKDVAQSEMQVYLNTYVLDGESKVTVGEPTVAPRFSEMAEVCSKTPTGLRSEMPKGADPSLQISIHRFDNSSLGVRLVEKKDAIAPGNTLLHIEIITDLDSDRMLARASSAGNTTLFDSVFVATRSGVVLAEKSTSKLNVRDVVAILINRSVRYAVEGGQKLPDDSSPNSADQGGLPGKVWGADQRFDVQVSGTSYVLFVAPAPFTLKDESNKLEDTPIAFYGLTRKDEIDAEAEHLPPLNLAVIFILMIVGMAFLWPALKLYTMSDRERLTKISVVAMLIVVTLATALLGALYLSYGFYLDTLDRDDQQLKRLSDRIREHFAFEVRDAIRVSESILRDEGATWNSPWKSWPRDEYHLLAPPGATLPSVPQIAWEGYPFLIHAIFLGRKPKGDPDSGSDAELEPVDERQIIKFSSTRIPTPLIPLPFSKFPFLERLLHGQHALLDNSRKFVIESFVSPNTGEFLPTLAFRPESPANSRVSIIATTQLPSLVHVLFPNGFGFAVVDPDGQVLFHSDPSRNKHENFFGETEESDGLRDALRREEPEYLSLRYGGRQIRAYVQPLGCEKGDHCISKLPLGLIVYVGMDAQKERLSSVGSDLLVYFLGLPMAALGFFWVATRLKHALWPATAIASGHRRIWPRHSDKAAYLSRAIWGLAFFSTAALIATLFRRFDLPLVLPFVLAALLVICAGGFMLFWRKHWAWIERFEHRIPLSTAFSASLYATVLAIAGIFFLLVFQLAVSSAQLRIESDNYDFLRAAFEGRQTRYLAVLHTYFDSPNLEGFDSDRNKKPYDLYDARLIEQPGLSRLSRVGPLLNLFTFFDEGDGLKSSSALQPVAPEAVPRTVRQTRPFQLEEIAVWNALPPLRYWLYFYLPGLLILVMVFLWMQLIVRRLFILDFREPGMLPTLSEEECRRRMQIAASVEGTQLPDRILIFAHPRSGTGVAIERIVACLKQELPAAAVPTVTDFGKISVVDNDDFSKPLAAATGARIVILDNFEVRLTEGKDREKKLALLEALVYSHGPSVYIFTSIDPLLLIESIVRGGQYSEREQFELNRWTRLLGNFERFVFRDDSLDKALKDRVDEVSRLCHGKPGGMNDYCEAFEAELGATLFLRACAARVNLDEIDFTGARHFEDSLIRQLRNLADGYYRVIWLNCTSDERLALYQLAKDDWLNPLNEVAISLLFQKELIHRDGDYRPMNVISPTHLIHQDGAYRLMNVSFRRFILEAVTAREVAIWKKQENLSLWPALRMAFWLAVFLVGLFVSYVWRGIFDVYLSYFVALAGGMGALLRFITQFFSKEATSSPVGGKDGATGVGST